MTGIIVFLIALFAMFAWFFYLFFKDPANLFKRERRYRRDDGPPATDGYPVIVPASGFSESSAVTGDTGFTPGGGDFGGAGSSGEWSSDSAGSDAASADGGGD